MKSIFVTKKTILLTILLMLVMCCLTITVALSYQQQVATAAGGPIVSTDELPDEDNSEEYDVMPITDANDSNFVSTWNNTGVTSITLNGNVTVNGTLKDLTRTLTLNLGGYTLNLNGAHQIKIGSGGTLTLEGSGTIKGGINDNGGAVWVNGGTFIMKGGTISGNTSTGNGGAVYAGGAESNVLISGGEISGNTSNGQYGGGGVYVTGGTLTISGSAMIKGNTAIMTDTDHGGGGVYVTTGAKFTMSGGTITENKASSGAGVFMSYWETNGSTFEMTGGTISNNIASYNGGAVEINEYCRFTMSGNASITGNKATNNGGGVFVSTSIHDISATFNMTGGTISGNISIIGAGVYVDGDGTFNMSNGEISNNNAKTGAGVFAKSKFTMKSGKISDNTATDDGGGVACESGGIFTMENGTITGNNANSGAGINVFNKSTVEIKGGTISNNTAADLGGGVLVQPNCSFTMSGSAKISGNNAVYGGGVYVSSDTFFDTKGTAAIFKISAGEILGNTATTTGGGVYVEGTFNLSGSPTIKDNTKGNAQNNIYLTSGKKVNLSGTVSGSKAIGVTAASNGIVTSGTALSNVNAFFADDTSKCVGISSSQLNLATHSPTKVTGQPSKDCVTNGCKDYYHCGTCNSDYSAASGGYQIFDLAAWKNDPNGGLIAASGAHNYDGAEWRVEAGMHKRNCNLCKQEDSHTSTSWSEWNTNSSTHTRSCQKCSLSDSHDEQWGEWSANGTEHERICSGGNEKQTHKSVNPNNWTPSDNDNNTHEGFCSGTNGCTVVITQDHGSALQWKDSSTEHWQECNDCLYQTEHQAHDYVGSDFHNDVDQAKHYQICTQEGCYHESERTDHNWSDWDTNGTAHLRSCVNSCGVDDQQHDNIVWGNWVTDGNAKDATHTGVCQHDDCDLTTTVAHSWEDVWNLDEVNGNHYQECTDCKEHYAEAHDNAEHITAENPAQCAKNGEGTLGTKTYSYCSYCQVFFDENDILIGDSDELETWLETDGVIVPQHNFNDNGVCQSCGKFSKEKQEQLEKDLEDANKKIEDRIKDLESKLPEPGLTEEEQQELDDLKDAQKKLEEAEKKLEDAEDHDEIDDALKDLEKALDDILHKMNKDAAKKEIQEKADEAKDIIDGLDGLTQEQKDVINGKIQDIADRVKGEIDDATSSDEIYGDDGILQKGKKEIQEIVDLEKAKQKAKEDVNKKADDAIKDVDEKLENGEITEDEANNRKKEIEEERKKALDDIENAKTPEEVEQKRQNAENALSSAANPNRPKIDLDVGLPIIILALQALIVAIVLIVVKSKR